MKKVYYILAFILLAVTLPAKKGVQNGEIFLTNYNLQKETVTLDGEWAFNWHKFVKPNENLSYEKNQQFVDYATTWSNIKGLRFNGQANGFATYRLKLTTKLAQENLGLIVPELYTSYRLFLNGSEIAQNGKPGINFTNTEPYWLPQVQRINLKAGVNNLVLHVANHHHHKGGAISPIILSSYDRLNFVFNFSKSGSLFITGALLIACIFSLTVFYFQRKDYSFLFFALFSFFYTYRIIGTDTYLLHDLLPSLNWFVTIRLEYFSLYASVISFAYFYKHLIRTRVPAWVFHLVAAVSAIGILSLLLPASYFTVLIDYYLIFILIATFVISIFYFIHFEVTHTLAWVTALSISALFFVLVIKSLSHFGLNSNYYYLTFIAHSIFVFFQVIALSQRFGYNLRREVVKSQEAKNSQRHFLNSVSHELKTPMNAIMGMLEMLREDKLEPEQLKKIETAHQNSEHLNALLHDLLNFSSIEAGEMKLKYRKFNLKELLDDILKSFKENYANKGINFSQQIDDSLPNFLVGDPEKIKLILKHLVDNAYKFTEKGKISFAVSAVKSDTHQINLRFIIKDTGKGISSKELERVIEAFYQGDRGNTRRYHGAGLGLTLSSRLVELMGGELWIDSTPGKGTTVEFDLVLRKPNEDFGKATAALKDDLGKLDPKLKILYAEDNPINQKLLTMMLKSLGYEIDIANNGLEAWEMALTNSYNIIFMDVQMPKMDGIEATKRIIQDIKNRPIIIAVTANADIADQKRCLAAGMNDFIAKPFNAKVLKEGLIKWQGLRRYLDADDQDDVIRLIS